MYSEFQFLFAQACRHFEGGKYNLAEGVLSKALRAQSKNFDALHLLGVIKALLNKHEEAKILFKKALQINPNDGLANFNYANCLSDLDRHVESLKYHKKASQLLPEDPEVWLNFGQSLDRMGAINDAFNCYQKAIKVAPHHPIATAKCADSLFRLDQYQDALNLINKALSLDSGMPLAWRTRGNLLASKKNFTEALFSFDQAIKLKPDCIEAIYDRALALNEMGRSDEACISFEKVVGIKKDYPYAWGALLYSRLQRCNWTGFDQNVKDLCESIDCKLGSRFIDPARALAILESPLRQKIVTEAHIKYLMPCDFKTSSLSYLNKSSKKIIIGYFSSDFSDHPVGHAIIGLLESHCREQFEIIGISLKPQDQSAVAFRIHQAFDRFVDLSGLGIEDSIEYVRGLNLDIAVDLNGFTNHSRPDLFARRISPVQVNYLGYPGTMGSRFMDYIIGDKVVIPDGYSDFYGEKVIRLQCSYLINCYQENPVKKNLLTRQSENLPSEGFVFCCFHSSYKITPDVFEIWMRLLLSVNGSVLWVNKTDSITMLNLLDKANSLGVASNRIIFANRIEDRGLYLQRLSLADLFLDTFIYNAHTTAADALWSCLPVLTCPGSSFASRVASSLLLTANLPEMIATTKVEYENLALRLANHPSELDAIKFKLKANRSYSPLFNRALVTKNIEAAYRKVHDLSLRGLPPEHFDIKGQ